MMLMRRMTAILALVALVVPAGVFPVSAAVSRSSFDAMIVSVSTPKTLTAGERSQVSVTFKNTGSAAWSQTGANYVSLYHYDSVKKLETPSLLSTAGWNGDTRPSKLPVSSVAPGGTVTFTFPIAAPSKIGTYHEEYLLVAENLVRMGNSKVVFDVNVLAKAAATNPIQPVSAPAPASTPAPAPAASGTPVSSGGKWAGTVVSQGGSQWQLDMEQNVFITMTFKNTGTETWKRSSGAYVSLYATENSGSGSKERTSLFATSNWSGARAASLVEAQVKPGETGTFKLEVRAPKSPGNYTEEFMLAAEGQAWMGGTRVTLKFNVPLTGAFIATAPAGSDAVTSVPVATQANNGRYVATVLLRSVTSLTLSGNGRQQLTYGFKNTGSSAWSKWNLTMTGVQPALSNNLSSVRDDSWKDAATPAAVTGSTKPGELGFLSFTIKAPAKKGSYTAKFQLYADNVAVDGGIIEIPITVTADGYIEPAPKPTVNNPTPTSPSVPSQPAPALNPQPLNGSDANLPNEPIIRVGLYQPDDAQMVVTARYAPITVTNNGSTVCHLASMQSTTISYDKSSRMYSINGGGCSGSGTTWYVARSDDGISPIEMSDYNRPVSWLPGANDNSFRAQLELRASLNNNELWVINELPIEWYLKGIGETSNSSPQQYQRALLTAARTYAMYHVQRGTKHAAQFYTVDATYDQVYRGYGAESRDPAVVQAVDATRGQIVTYQGQLAITPYYSRSDGRTRAWSEVWGGSVPWCVSVPVPWDQGKTLWGHGVGMSATGALQMDAKDGYTYDRILSHFYTGTELRKAYK